VTIFALDVLKLIPVPVLYGVFLFMGLVSLGTNQFWGRMLMFFMQPAKYPVQPYTQYMKPKRMHLFTLIQLFFFALLYTVKSIKTIAILFPICIAACIPVRLYLLPKIFTNDELILIDSEPETVKIWIANNQAKEEEEETLIGESTKDGSKQGDVEEGEIMKSKSANEEAPAPPRRRRVKRTKTMSCPTGALMFTEEPSALGPQLRPQMFVGNNAGLYMMGASPSERTATVKDDSTHTADSLEGIDLATSQNATGKPRRRHRPSREERRALSCPVADAFFQVELVNPASARGPFSKNADEQAKQNLPTLHESLNHSTHSK
jgi:hypothetical protein